MLTREEQIKVLEEQFNWLIVKMKREQDNSRPWQGTEYAKYMTGIVEALTYLRTVIPCPMGRVDPVGPRRRLHL
jgi:hypothetical protein